MGAEVVTPEEPHPFYFAVRAKRYYYRGAEMYAGGPWPIW
jgi:hypothetical protein